MSIPENTMAQLELLKAYKEANTEDPENHDHINEKYLLARDGNVILCYNLRKSGILYANEEDLDELYKHIPDSLSDQDDWKVVVVRVGYETETYPVPEQVLQDKTAIYNNKLDETVSVTVLGSYITGSRRELQRHLRQALRQVEV